jgi:hypothetical protein
MTHCTRQYANPSGEVWFHFILRATIDLIDTTAADCTLPDQHDAAGERGTAKFGNGARWESQQ